MEDIFGGTDPPNPQKDSAGIYNYQKARSIKVTYLLRNNETAFEYVYDVINSFADAHSADNIQIEVYSQNLLYEALNVGV